MSDSASASALSDRPAPTVQRTLVVPLVWLACCLGTALAIYGMAMLISVSSERDAARFLAEAESGRDYLAVLVGVLAVGHGRSDRHR